jgi:foldase protein PrsA
LKTAREAALQELIDYELMRLQIEDASPRVSASDAEINERQQRLVGRYETKAAFETAMKSQGIATERELRDRLAAGLCQEKFIEQKIAPVIKVTDEEARQWFDANQVAIAQPERVEVRHIFIPTLDEALVLLTEKKKDFATLAKEISEDPASKDSGGALGWMSRDRLPADFSAPLFSLDINKPTLIRTRLGWHLVEVTGRKPAEACTYEQAKSEILSALDAVKRRQAIADYRKELRKSMDGKIEIF